MLDADGIKELIKGMAAEVRSIRKNAFQLSWYMRGGLSYTDALNLSNEEREVLNEIITSNLETTKKINMPFF